MMSQHSDYLASHKSATDMRRMRDDSPDRATVVEVMHESLPRPTTTKRYKVRNRPHPNPTRRPSLSSSFDSGHNDRRAPAQNIRRSPSQNSISTLPRSLSQISSAPDIVIMVMGVTGSGKSSFINLLSDRDVQVGHSLTSCTTEPEVYTVPLSKNRRAYLIDTPGFDDTSRPDEDILKSIAFLVNRLYQSGKRLSAMVYMHRITDVRMGGASVRNLELFRKICGRDAFPHVALVSTMWELMEGDERHRVGVQREEGLLDEARFWKDFKDGGSRVMRHGGTKESARNVFRNLPLSMQGFTLDLQREMDEGLPLNETAAGRFLQHDLMQLKKKHEQSLRQLQKEIEEARAEGDVDVEQMLRGEHKATISKISQNDTSVRALNINTEELIQEQAPVYREDVDMKEQVEISHDPELRQQAAEMRELKKEILQLRAREEESQIEIDELRRRDQARSRTAHGRSSSRRAPRGPGSPSSSRYLAQLEARYEKEEARIERILLNKGSPHAWLKSILDVGARFLMNSLPNRPLQRSSTDPSTLSRYDE